MNFLSVLITETFTNIFSKTIISGSLIFWSVNHTSVYENSEQNKFRNIDFFGEISNNSSNDLLGTNVYQALGSGR